MAVVRRGLIGMIVVILGVAAISAVTSSTAAKVTKKHDARCAKAPKRKGKHAKRRAKCKKAHGKPRGSTPSVTGPTGTTPTTTGPATIVEPIPTGVSAISVYAKATYPRNVSYEGTLSEPHAVGAVISSIEGLRVSEPTVVYDCAEVASELTLELQFRRSAEMEPVAVAVGSYPFGCDWLDLTIRNTTDTPRFDARCVISLVEHLLEVSWGGAYPDTCPAAELLGRR